MTFRTSTATKREMEALVAIRRYADEHDGRSPTMAELAVMLGCGKVTAYGHVRSLARKGHIEVVPYVHRSIRLKDCCPTCLRPWQPGAETGATP